VSEILIMGVPLRKDCVAAVRNLLIDEIGKISSMVDHA
jgi:hypothetical protein